MIAPITLSALLAGTRIEAARAAVVAAIGAMLPGVTVVEHPGKLDINDVVAKAVVAAPGVAVGYTRVRELGDAGGTFALAVDFAAYVVVEDMDDRSGPRPRRVAREVVGHAIGLQLLRILRDPDAASWGLVAVEPPSQDPGPVMTPVFTMKTAEGGAAVYAVTWTQSLVQEGAPFFDGPNPPADLSGLPGPTPGDDELVFDDPPGDPNDYPPEILAYLRRGGPVAGER